MKEVENGLTSILHRMADESPTPKALPAGARRMVRAVRLRRGISASFVTLLIAAGIAIPLKILLPLTDTTRPRLQPGVQPDVQPSNAPAMGGPTGTIMYAKNVDGGWGLFTLDPSSGTETQITSGVRDYGSDWSPDGTQIVHDQDNPSLVVSNRDGSDSRVLLQGAGEVPAWSPDGTTIAYTDFDNRAIWTIALDGSAKTQVTRPPKGSGTDWGATWSPDGTQIAFGRETEGSQLVVTTLDGTERHMGVPGQENGFFGTPEWSPDGSTILVAVFGGGSRGREGGGLVLVPANGSGKVTTIRGTEFAQDPTWSPDGKWIAYTEDKDHAITLIRPNGEDQHTLAIAEGNDGPQELTWGLDPADNTTP